MEDSRDERLLGGLLKRRGEHVPGGELARALGISRAALWKRISSLRKRGFTIEAGRGKGYRLIGVPDLSPEILRSSVRGALGRRVVFIDTVDSTNEIAMELAASGAAHGTAVVAESQKKGRGRLGRRWVSPGGKNIYLSVVLRPEVRPRQAGLLTLMAAAAAAAALKEVAGLDVRIKWPNDLIVGGRKLGGVLTEVRSEPDRVLFAVAGVGVNVNMRAGEFPADFRDSATSVFMETGRTYSRTALMAALLDAFDAELLMFREKGGGPLLARMRGLSSTLGREVTVAAGRDTLRGVAEDLDDEGCLVLKVPEGIRRICSGDITHLREDG